MILDGSDRKLNTLRELVTFVSLALSVMCSFFFMLAMHFLVAVVVPQVMADTFIIIIVSICSIALAVSSSRTGEHKLQHSFGLVSIVVMLYIVTALTISFSTSYPGLYTLPYAMFGAFATTNLFASFSEIGRLFAGIPKWRENPEIFTPTVIRHELTRFDHYVRTVSTTLISIIAAFSIGAVLAFTTNANVSNRFLLPGAPFLWMATVLVVYTRVVVRLKRMVIAGHRVEEQHIVQPMVYTVIGSVAVLIVAGVLARDDSILDYTVFIRMIEKTFNIQSADGGSIGYLGSSGGGPSSRVASAPMRSSGGGGSADIEMLLDLFRYGVLGGAIIGIVVYIIYSVKRMQREGMPTSSSVTRYLRRRQFRLRLVLIRLQRLWRLLVANIRDFFRRTSRRDTVVPRRKRSERIADRRADEIDRKIERNTVLRWYRSLVAWGTRHGIETPGATTADEFLTLLAHSHPEHSTLARAIADAFNAACYSRERIGRSRLKEYVGNVRTIIADR